MIRALIYDLDNTIYPVKSISDELFAGLFKIIDEDPGLSKADIAAAKEEVTRRPFQKIADEYGFSNDLKQQGIELLETLTYNKPMQAFDDFKYVKSLQVDKFLVTTGFIRMQSSKVKMLDIAADFKKVYIVDPQTTDKTKRHFFLNILEKYNYSKDEVLVVGDDPESEIKEAKAIGIKTVLYDPQHKYTTADADHVITNHQQIQELLLA
ncbi:MAG: HAD family hydrolase [Sphingobacteriaceae bacterium]|nr:MAG: HAD family hydrolase [Sphingobacteriaceae bacterium]